MRVQSSSNPIPVCFRVARDEGVVEGGDESPGGLAQVHGIEVATPRPEVESVEAFVKLLPRLC